MTLKEDFSQENNYSLDNETERETHKDYHFHVRKVTVTFDIWEIIDRTFRFKNCQLAFTCSKSVVETLEKGVKYVQS